MGGVGCLRFVGSFLVSKLFFSVVLVWIVELIDFFRGVFGVVDDVNVCFGVVGVCFFGW